MPPPFPGMDPYLERPDLWPDVHNRLIAAIGDELSPVIRPRYYVALEERTYLEEPAELILVGRPDLAVVSVSAGPAPAKAVAGGERILDVELPMALPVRETYLEVRGVADGEVVTVIEILSPANKRPGTGRRLYLDERTLVLATGTSLIEIDLRVGRVNDSLPPTRASREQTHAERNDAHVEPRHIVWGRRHGEVITRSAWAHGPGWGRSRYSSLASRREPCRLRAIIVAEQID